MLKFKRIQAVSSRVMKQADNGKLDEKGCTQNWDCKSREIMEGIRTTANGRTLLKRFLKEIFMEIYQKT